MKVQHIFKLSVLLLLFIYSCQNGGSNVDHQKIITEWTGRTVIYPLDVECYSPISDTECSDVNTTPFTVLVFTDSIGCASCDLQLYKWSRLIDEVDSIMPQKMSFKFYFHPKDVKELKFLMKRENFKHPVYFDIENKIGKLNRFSSERNFHSFLLDKDNQVVLIGNPIVNIQLWDLFKKKAAENIIIDKNDS